MKKISMVVITLTILACAFLAHAGKAISPDQREKLCAEKIKALTTVQTDLDETRYSSEYFQTELEEMQKELDEQRKYATAAQLGNWDEIPLAWFADGCVAAIKNGKVGDEKIANTCVNFELARLLEDVNKQKRRIEEFKELEKNTARELFQIRDILTAMGCEFTMPKPSPEKVAREPGAHIESPMPAAKPLVGTEVFLGKWSGTATLVASNRGGLGTSQPYTLEIYKQGNGVGLSTPAGPIGNPALYRTKLENNHLRVDYSGPPPTVAVPGVDVTLTYWLDVTVSGDKLAGQTYTHSEASYEGKTTEMWFQTNLVLHK